MKAVLIRCLDMSLAVCGLLVVSPLLLILLGIGFWDTGAPLFTQQRIGRYRHPFRMVKLRTMRRGTASVATHLADSSAVTAWGRWLRKTKLDELPQLWNVVMGEMSLVGPRPCLLNQQTLIVLREQYDIFSVRPGITGLAQLARVDMSDPEVLSDWDKRLIQSTSVRLYFRILWRTVLGKGYGDRLPLN